MTSFSLAKVMEVIPQNGLDFEYCAVMQSESRKIVFTNTTKEIINFDVKVDVENTSFKCDTTNGKLLKYLK
jgi:hypothetical protein